MQLTPLRPFQRTFVRGATAPGITTSALSIARGNGKSWLAGYLVGRILDPEDELFRPGTESVLVAASLEQARIVYRFGRRIIEPRGGYRFLDSHNRIGVTHVPTGTRLRVIGSNARTAFGLVDCPWVIGDEPGAWEVRGGEKMADALETAQGKPGSPLRLLLIGTLAPAESGWWHDLIGRGSDEVTYVQKLQGDRETWDNWHTIRKANPLTNLPGQPGADFRKQLLRERDRARRDPRLKARFLSYRLNLPTADESVVLLTVPDWKRLLKRKVPPRSGRPIVGVDLGGGRAWSAAVAVWKTGRVEALALAPGLPPVRAQEKRDRVPRGTYSRLVDAGVLVASEGRRVPPVSDLWSAIRFRFGRPARIVADRFRESELRDEIPAGIPLDCRVSRWSESTADIRALRRGVLDGPFGVEPRSRPLMEASLAVAKVENDTSGNSRIRKRGTHNEARDDVASAWVLAAGAFQRATSESRPTTRYLGAV